MIQMADSIVPEDLPGTYPAYLGYVDGTWKTAGPVRAKFPKARLVTLTVRAGGAVADGCDCEPGDMTVSGAVLWAKWRIQTGAWRPVLYANISTMVDVIAFLPKAGLARSQLRLLSAHYGEGNHVCGPKSGPDDTQHCGYPGIATEMDGTQWTDTAAGVGGTVIDLSTLNDDFFGTVSKVTDLPINVCGSYTDGKGDLFVIGTDKAGVLHESKRTASGVWTTPYAIAGKTGA